MPISAHLHGHVPRASASAGQTDLPDMTLTHRRFLLRKVTLPTGLFPWAARPAPDRTRRACRNGSRTTRRISCIRACGRHAAKGYSFVTGGRCCRCASAQGRDSSDSSLRTGPMQTIQTFTELATPDKIKELIRANPKITQGEMAKSCGLSRTSIANWIRRSRGAIRRVGFDNGGFWQVIE